MVLILEYQGVYLTYYYYLLYIKKINGKELTDILEPLKLRMIPIYLTTIIPYRTIQNKIKPIQYISN